MATTDIGRAVPLLRGEYDPAQTYELNDIVSLNGSLYWHYSHEVTTNVAPQATSTWKVVLSLTDAEAYIARAETAAEEAESAKDDAVTAKTAAETASTTATGASEAATAAKDDAVTARNAAQTAETGAVEAKNAAVSAKEAAQSAASSAGTSATSAGNSAGTAEYYATNAETAAETATTKASEASASATTASSAATTATEAKNTAVSSASTATTKAGEASTSATSAASSAAAAQAVKDSIPEDYSELSEDVSDLKTQFDEQSEWLGYPKNLFDGSAWNASDTSNWGFEYTENSITYTHKTQWAGTVPSWTLDFTPGEYVFYGTTDIVNLFGLYIDDVYTANITNGYVLSVENGKTYKVQIIAIPQGTTRTISNISITNNAPNGKIQTLETQIGELNVDVDELQEETAETKDTLSDITYKIKNALEEDAHFATINANGWYKAYNESTVSVLDGVATFNAGRQFGSLRHGISVEEGNKYYFFGTVKANYNKVSINFNADPPLASHSGSGEFEFLSGIYTATGTNTLPFMILDTKNSDWENIEAKNVGIINLTETFGPGKEPSTEAMNKILHANGDFIMELSILKTNNDSAAYEQKKILFMGDSITAANLNNNGWCKYFNAIMNPVKTVNVAVSGAVWHDYEDTVYDGNPVTTYQTNNTIGNQVEKIARGKDTTNPNYSHVADYDDFDIIIISAGTNDGKNNFNTDDIKPSIVELTWGTPLAYTSIDTKKSVGAMVYAYERLYTMYPNAKFFYCTPIQTYPSKKGWGENQYKGEVMKETGNFIPPIIIDSEKCGIFGNQEQYSTEGVNLYDGLHPNAHGAKLLGEYNANAIIKFYLGR